MTDNTAQPLLPVELGPGRIKFAFADFNCIDFGFAKEPEILLES